jgi:hypothetical protein
MIASGAGWPDKEVIWMLLVGTALEGIAGLSAHARHAEQGSTKGLK